MKSHTSFTFSKSIFIKLLVISGSSILSTTPAFSQENTFPNFGNAGIGTLAPITRLEVVQRNGGALVAKFRNAALSNDRTALVDIQSGNGVLWRYGVGGTGNGLGINAGQFYIERLGVGALITVDQNGNTGIGTTAPEQRLHVNGTEVLSTGFQAGFKFRNRGTATNVDDWVWYSTGNVARLWRAGVGDLLGITPSGNLGIGTTSPQSRLHFTGDLTTNWGLNFYHYEPSSAAQHVRKVWLQRSWNGTIGDYLMLCSSGNRSNTVQSSMLLAEGGVFFGRGKDDGTGLSTEWMRIGRNGNVGIGTTPLSNFKLAVCGRIRANGVVVNTGWCDYVFEEGYNLMPLNEVEKFINTNKHLPDVPSAAEVEKNGIELGEMNATLLRKIEELTLHVIELKKENDALKSRLDNLTIQASQK